MSDLGCEACGHPWQFHQNTNGCCVNVAGMYCYCQELPPKPEPPPPTTLDQVLAELIRHRILLQEICRAIGGIPNA